MPETAAMINDGERRARHVRLVRFALLVASILVSVGVWLLWYKGGLPVDAWCYYNPTYGRDAFQYLWSPAFAQLTTPLQFLSFYDFTGVVRALELTALVAMAPYGHRSRCSCLQSPPRSTRRTSISS